MLVFSAPQARIGGIGWPYFRQVQLSHCLVINHQRKGATGISGFLDDVTDSVLASGYLNARLGGEGKIAVIDVVELHKTITDKQFIATAAVALQDIHVLLHLKVKDVYKNPVLYVVGRRGLEFLIKL
jgi:hypothetical protein